MRSTLVLVAVSVAVAFGLRGAALAQDAACGGGELPVQQIEAIIGAEGHVASGVLEISLAR